MATLQTLIAAYEAAMLSFATNGAQQSYKFDSQQEVITVERADPKAMAGIVDSLISQLDVACVRAGLQSSSVQVRGAY